jgi:hypothetical protein
MDDNLIIECVWYQSKRDFNKFIRAVEDPKACIIDYSLIKNKLVKADPYNQEPTDSVIGVNIISMIKSSLNPEGQQISTIVYSFKNLTVETVSNFKELIDQYTDRNRVIVLNVLNMDRVPSKKVLNIFDCVKFVGND